MSQVRSGLYALARLLGDISAASKGPDALAKRMARRAAGRAMAGCWAGYSGKPPLLCLAKLGIICPDGFP